MATTASEIESAAKAEVDSVLSMRVALEATFLMPQHTAELIRELMVLSFIRGASWQQEKDVAKVASHIIRSQEGGKLQ